MLSDFKPMILFNQSLTSFCFLAVFLSPSGKPCSLLAKDFLRFTWFLWSQAGCRASWPLAAADGSLLCDLQSATARLWASVSQP